MEPEALSTVFTAAIKAIEAELRSGGGLDTSQRKFLRETYSNAGREEERYGERWMVDLVDLVEQVEQVCRGK